MYYKNHKGMSSGSWLVCSRITKFFLKFDHKYPQLHWLNPNTTIPSFLVFLYQETIGQYHFLPYLRYFQKINAEAKCQLGSALRGGAIAFNKRKVKIRAEHKLRHDIPQPLVE